MTTFLKIAYRKLQISAQKHQITNKSCEAITQQQLIIYKTDKDACATR